MKNLSAEEDFVIQGTIVNKTGITLYIRIDEFPNSEMVFTISYNPLKEGRETLFCAPALPLDEMPFSTSPNQPADNDEVFRSHRIELVESSLKVEIEGNVIDEDDCSQTIDYSIKLLQ